MTNIDKNSLAMRFGNSSVGYEDATPTQDMMSRFLMEKITQHFSDKKISSILELGCGTGRLTRQLIEAFPEAQVTAIDISSDMVLHAKKLCSKANYIEADAEKYVHSLANKFDLIVSNAAIQWFENPQITLKKALELLAPRGYMAIATFANRTFFELSSAFKNAYDFYGIAERHHVLPMMSLKELQNILPQTEIFDSIIQKTFPSVRAFLRSIQEAGAVNSLGERFVIPKKVFKKMVEYYLTNHSDHKTGEVFATYHACYIFCDNS